MNFILPAQLWIASGNPRKSKELLDFSRLYFTEFKTINLRAPKNVEENEPTFLGNAKLKSSALAAELIDEGHRDFAVLGDDSGLCVDLLNGQPGIFSARYSGVKSTPKKNLEKLLHDLSSMNLNIYSRTAQNQCALNLMSIREGKTIGERSAVGMYKGFIALEPKGTNGYAYDSVFIDPKTNRTHAELSYFEKQIDSHRDRAFIQLRTLVAGGFPQ